MRNIPAVTIGQMREVDRLMVEEIGVSILMMMENASRNIAVLARNLLGGSVKEKKIIILCGKGNNGGDGLGAARYLINFGANCKVFLSSEADKLSTEARTQFNVLKNINAETHEYGTFSDAYMTGHLEYADLIIDALLGYNLKGDPKDPIANFIRLANKSNKPILAVDIPSGLEGNTGYSGNPTIRANTTITLALPKVGLLTDIAKEYVGKLYLADLSVPKKVYEKIGIEVPVIFEKEEVIEVFQSHYANE